MQRLILAAIAGALMSAPALAQRDNGERGYDRERDRERHNTGRERYRNPRYESTDAPKVGESNPFAPKVGAPNPYATQGGAPNPYATRGGDPPKPLTDDKVRRR
jgi:hypothetical protein